MSKSSSPLSKGAKRRKKKGLPVVTARNPSVVPMRNRQSGAHTNKKHEQRKKACRGKYRGD